MAIEFNVRSMDLCGKNETGKTGKNVSKLIV